MLKRNFLPSKEQLFWLAVLAIMAIALTIVNTTLEPLSVLTAALLTGFASVKLWRSGFKELPAGCTIATVLLGSLAMPVLASSGAFSGFMLVAESMLLVLTLYVWIHGLFAVFVLVVYAAARIAMRLGTNRAKS